MDTTNWSVDSFPDPNPYFPAPPRKDKETSTSSVVVCAVAAVVFDLAVVIGFGQLDWVRSNNLVIVFVFVVILALACSVGVGFGIGHVLNQIGWRVGRIVPARVVSGATSRLTISPLGTVKTLLAGPSLEDSPIGSSRYVEVEYVDDGIICRSGVTTTSKNVTTGEFVWLTLYGAKPILRLLSDCRPSHLTQSFVPPEAKEWLRKSIAARRASLGLEPEDVNLRG